MSFWNVWIFFSCPAIGHHRLAIWRSSTCESTCLCLVLYLALLFRLIPSWFTWYISPSFIVQLDLWSSNMSGSRISVVGLNISITTTISDQHSVIIISADYLCGWFAFPYPYLSCSGWISVQWGKCSSLAKLFAGSWWVVTVHVGFVKHDTTLKVQHSIPQKSRSASTNMLTFLLFTPSPHIFCDMTPTSWTTKEQNIFLQGWLSQYQQHAGQNDYHQFWLLLFTAWFGKWSEREILFLGIQDPLSAKQTEGLGVAVAVCHKVSLSLLLSG